jgi:flagellar hook-basal body complex protein FliE
MSDLINKIHLARPTGTSSYTKAQPTKNSDGSFGNLLKDAMDESNQIQQKGEKALADLATGQVKDLHQAALALNKAETSMKMMLEVRNKALSAYKEIMRTQI